MNSRACVEEPCLSNAGTKGGYEEAEKAPGLTWGFITSSAADSHSEPSLVQSVEWHTIYLCLLNWNVSIDHKFHTETRSQTM